MNFKHLNIIIILLSILVLASIAYVSLQVIKYYPSAEIENISPYNVVRVIDGDTFVMQNGETVRLLCVNTPEENEQGYDTAKLFLENLILNKEVRLESGTPDRDQYNRLLRYVYLDSPGTEIFVNLEIIRYNVGELFPYNNTNCDTMFINDQI